MSIGNVQLFIGIALFVSHSLNPLAGPDLLTDYHINTFFLMNDDCLQDQTFAIRGDFKTFYMYREIFFP